jgi:hypothetical protein
MPLKIRYGYHKTQNLMLSLNPLNKEQKNPPKKTYIERKLLHTLIKRQNIYFSVTFSLITFFA